ncbi:uncharacterized protein LOC112588198 [Harpegnathos saltator]|uniref:uncharacterized protein LOC112588198 n=1 Tax=Harpegnathos saltator TaxID=610380 RepID=UPI000DBEF070|nr:uncharacterized protein LOC112588198 [Harpegnathos saltator]
MQRGPQQLPPFSAVRLLCKHRDRVVCVKMDAKKRDFYFWSKTTFSFYIFEIYFESAHLECYFKSKRGLSLNLEFLIKTLRHCRRAENLREMTREENFDLNFAVENVENCETVIATGNNNPPVDVFPAE